MALHEDIRLAVEDELDSISKDITYILTLLREYAGQHFVATCYMLRATRYAFASYVLRLIVLWATQVILRNSNINLSGIPNYYTERSEQAVLRYLFNHLK